MFQWKKSREHLWGVASMEHNGIERDAKLLKKGLRTMIYLLGMATLALGLSLNTLTGWGVAPIISLAAVFSSVLNISYGTACAAQYVILVAAQLLLLRRNAGWMHLLQIPVSFILGFFIDFFSGFLPGPQGMAIRLLYLAFGITCTGVGACMILNMRLASSPADGFVQAVSDVTGRSRGLCKNIIDLSCAVAALVLGLVLTGEIVGIGIGTVAAVICTGRVMALFDRLTKETMCALAGVPGPGSYVAG